jgi:hypothetical protein
MTKQEFAQKIVEHLERLDTFSNHLVEMPELADDKIQIRIKEIDDDGEEIDGSEQTFAFRVEEILSQRGKAWNVGT